MVPSSMSPFSITGPLKCNNRIMSFSALPFSVTYNNCCKNISLPRKLHRNVNIHDNSFSSFSFQTSIHENLYFRKQRGLSLIAFDAKKNSEPVGEDNDQALDAVMKLYSAFKNKNIQELSEILADECRCVCNFLSFFQAFQGKTVYLLLFSAHSTLKIKIISPLFFLFQFSFIRSKILTILTYCLVFSFLQQYFWILISDIDYGGNNNLPIKVCVLPHKVIVY